MEKEKLHNEIAGKQNICQIVILKNGEEVYSEEFNGYKKTDCAHVMSVTKSIMALLVGIAVDKGFIKSIDDKVLDYFPDYRVKRGEKTIYDVTIKHLLTMKAPYKGKGDPWTKVCTSENWTTASLDFLGGTKGLTEEFDYRTVCFHIISGLLYEATHMITIDFANKYLFGPLGIAEYKNFVADTVEKHVQFTVSKTPKENVWFSDPQHLGTPGYGLCMSAQNMAKIGELVRLRGMYNGQRVISSQWIDTILTPTYQTDYRYGNMQYGYLWWIPFRDKKIYAASGNSGNVIYIDSDMGLVIAITSYFKPRVLDRIEFIDKVIKPLL